MQLQLKNSKIPPISIAEILIIFLLILAAMSFEIWRNVLLPFHYPLNQKIITLILQKAILTSIIGIFIFLWQKNRYGLIKIGLIIFIIVCASMINAQPNYNAKIVEARAAWKAQNYQLLISKANEALPLTRDKNEKAVAYYWIG